jgi:hypothetical protein
MRTMKLLIAALFLIAGCTGGNNNTANDNNLSQDNDLHHPDSLSGKGSASVVHPMIPDRKIKVGGNKADIQGYTSQAIQTAIEAIHSQGGGTVIILPGNYEVIAPVRLYDNISLVGSGPETILKKTVGFRSRFAIDADYGEMKITVADVTGFKPGMGIAVYDSKQRRGWDVSTAVITSIKDSTIYIDNYLQRDYSAADGGTVSNACSVISAVEADNVKISNLTVDGNRKTNDVIDGCRAGGVYLHKVHNATVENVIVRDFNSDGISWQITEYVTVKNCEVSGCASIGLHPGTGSPYTLIEGNNSHNNDDYGLYVCWRVRNGIALKNELHNNGRNGISTGHKDTDMLYADNHIYENGSDGVNLRNDGPLNAPHRSIFKNNLVENNGVKKGGYGFSFSSPAQGVVLENNIIRNVGEGKQLAAVFMSKKSLPVTMKDNKISGHSKGDILKEQD